MDYLYNMLYDKLYNKSVISCTTQSASGVNKNVNRKASTPVSILSFLSLCLSSPLFPSFFPFSPYFPLPYPTFSFTFLSLFPLFSVRSRISIFQLNSLRKRCELLQRRLGGASAETEIGALQHYNTV